jgi:hypothetical protein
MIVASPLCIMPYICCVSSLNSPYHLSCQVMVRQHHCRICSKAVCNSCSLGESHTATLLPLVCTKELVHIPLLNCSITLSNSANVCLLTPHNQLAFPFHPSCLLPSYPVLSCLAGRTTCSEYGLGKSVRCCSTCERQGF